MAEATKLMATQFIKLITSKACDPANPIGYQTRLIVSVAVCLGVRLGALAALTMNQFTHSTSNDSKVILFTAKIGSRRGGTKNQVGGRQDGGQTTDSDLNLGFSNSGRYLKCL